MQTLDARPDSAARDGSSPGVASDEQAPLLTYEPFFGLREKAFSLSANPTFHYRSSDHADAFAQVDAGIRRREGLIVLTGEIGSGKTTLCRAVLEQLDRRTYSTFVVDPFLSREELLKAMLVGFGVMSLTDLRSGHLAAAARQELSFALRDFLESLVPVQAFAVLVIDEAQHLSPLVLEEVRILAELETRHKLIQVVLVGPPDLRAALKRPDLRHVEQHVSVRCELSVLDPATVRGYIAHRLALAAHGGTAPVFTEAAAAIVATASGGVPRIVNRICDRALHVAWASRSASIRAEMVRLALIDLEVAIPDGAFDEASCESAVIPLDRTSRIDAPACATDASPVMAPHAPVLEQRETAGMHRASSSEHRPEKAATYKPALSGRVWGTPAVDTDALTQFTDEVAVETRGQTGDDDCVAAKAGISAITPTAFSATARRFAVIATALTLVAIVMTGVGALNINMSQGRRDGTASTGALPLVPVSGESSAVNRALVAPDEHLAALNDSRSRAPGSYAIRAGVFASRNEADAFASQLSGTGHRAAIRQQVWPGLPQRVRFELIVEGHGTLENAMTTANRLRGHSGGEDAAIVGLPGAFAGTDAGAP
jgi:type II secretory pathway predicted ATPase ExeA